MNLLGVSLKITGEKVKTTVDRTAIEKETEKQYKVKNNSLLTFNCLSNISKDMIGKIQGGSFKDYINSFERKIWVIDDGISEQLLIEQLKEEIVKELDNRNIMNIKMMKGINSI